MSRPPFLTDHLTVEPFAGTGARGPTYGAAVRVRASVQPSFQLIIDASGRQFQASALAIVRPGAIFPVESRATDSAGRVYRVLADNPLPDAERPDHREIQLGSIQ